MTALAGELEARARKAASGSIELYAPRPGLWRGAPPSGALVRPGSAIGELEVCGVLCPLRAPADASGIVISPEPRLARSPVDCATVLLVLDPERTVAALTERGAAGTAVETSGPVFRTPLGGRYYARPAPGADPFVRPGDEVSAGTTVAVIEVMKTFNRVTFGGPGMPPRARVKAIVPGDGDDVEAGDVLLELEAGG